MSLTVIENDICKLFNISEEHMIKMNKTIDNFIKSYFKNEMIPYNQEHFSYLGKLDNNLDEYASFGADKAGINDFNEFCEKLNIDPIQDLSSSRIFHFYSRDNKLVISFSSKMAINDGYFHYFGISGGKKEVLLAFDYFIKNGYRDELCFHGRSFI